MSKEVKLALIVGAGIVIGNIVQAFIQPMITKKAVAKAIEEGDTEE